MEFSNQNSNQNFLIELPFSGASSPDNFIRNRAIEEALAALKLPKRCRSERCQFEGVGRELMQHEKRCRVKKLTRRIDLLVPWYK